MKQNKTCTLQEAEGRLVRLKKKMTGRKSRNMIELDLIERSLSYCPAMNVSRIRDLMSWDQFESEAMDKCVASGCDGDYDLCCPYMDLGALQVRRIKRMIYFVV